MLTLTRSAIGHRMCSTNTATIASAAVETSPKPMDFCAGVATARPSSVVLGVFRSWVAGLLLGFSTEHSRESVAQLRCRLHSRFGRCSDPRCRSLGGRRRVLRGRLNERADSRPGLSENLRRKADRNFLRRSERVDQRRSLFSIVPIAKTPAALLSDVADANENERVGDTVNRWPRDKARGATHRLRDNIAERVADVVEVGGGDRGEGHIATDRQRANGTWTPIVEHRQTTDQLSGTPEQDKGVESAIRRRRPRQTYTERLLVNEAVSFRVDLLENRPHSLPRPGAELLTDGCVRVVPDLAKEEGKLLSCRFDGRRLSGVLRLSGALPQVAVEGTDLGAQSGDRDLFRGRALRRSNGTRQKR